jgi:hypothetical protein
VKVKTKLTEAVVEGGDTSIRYVIILTAPGMHYEPMEWRTKARGGVPSYGAPTNANLKKFMDKFIETMQPGGHNDHLAQGGRGIPTRASIYDQNEHRVVSSWMNFGS